jgi:FixJ family two-component response regulator
MALMGSPAETEGWLRRRRQYESLSPRERPVFRAGRRGLVEQTVCRRVEPSGSTVKLHRSEVMQNIEAQSFAELVAIAGELDLTSATKSP